MPDAAISVDSKHFTVQQLKEGIYALIAKKGGWAICNAGIIDLGGICLLFDTFVCPSAAEDLQKTAGRLVESTPDIIINSHYHNDHVWGNQVFPLSAHIVASDRTYQLMATEGKKEFEEAKVSAARTLAHFQDGHRKAGTPEQRDAAELFVGKYEGIVHDLPRLSPRLPDITFKERLVFRGSKRSAELIAYNDCHSGNDAILFLPDDGIIYMGDLLFVGFHPYLGDGDPVNLVKILKKIKGFNATRLVPGHGELGTVEDLDLLIEYIESCIKTARSLVKEDRTDKGSLDAMQVPNRFKHWHLPAFYRSNLRAVCSQLTSG